MMRKDLQPFKNKNVVVTGVVAHVCWKNPLDIDKEWKRNVKILLKEVMISGVEVDHIWLFERKKQFDSSKAMIGETVKFKAKVTPYVKQRDGIYVEDYGIERSSKLVLKSVYDTEPNVAYSHRQYN